MLCRAAVFVSYSSGLENSFSIDTGVSDITERKNDFISFSFVNVSVEATVTGDIKAVS